MTPLSAAATWIRGSTRVWSRNFESWKDFAAASLVGTLAEPLLTLFAIGFGLGRLVEPIGGQSYVAFLAPGLLASTAMTASAFETTFGSFTRLTEQGTYEAIVRTPISVGEVVAGDILWGASKSVLGAGFVLALMWILGLTATPLSVGTLPMAFLVGLMFGALGMSYTALAPSYAFFNYFFTLVITVMYLFSGVFFPLDGLPPWAVGAAWCLPLTHAVIVIRALAAGELQPFLLVHLGIVAAFTAVAFPVATRLIRRRLIK
ncbi:MAG TPA: ABC transporter permease [Gemmatimonadota bacterium]|nr:ABC transporter permease [Gemmatimonadota bacterium]